MYTFFFCFAPIIFLALYLYYVWIFDALILKLLRRVFYVTAVFTFIHIEFLLVRIIYILCKHARFFFSYNQSHLHHVLCITRVTGCTLCKKNYKRLIWLLNSPLEITTHTNVFFYLWSKKNIYNSYNHQRHRRHYYYITSITKRVKKIVKNEPSHISVPQHNPHRH